jgi:OFA family oxalate/formate antiporter-like MFS transporter
MPHEKLPSRWPIAVAAFIMQICLGAAYGWSVFSKPLVATEHWLLTSVQLNFTLAILFLGVGTVIGGLWQERVGPRRVATVAGILYGLSYILAGFAVRGHSLIGMYLTYGVMGGIGMGMGYITPAATLVKWFPAKRRLMTGVAVCGYGAGALIMSPIAARTIRAYGVPATMIGLGVVYFFLVVSAARFYANPPAGWTLAGYPPRSTVQKSATKIDFSVSEAMQTWQFWLLWFMLFVNVSAGIMIISMASPMAQEMIHMAPVAAASMVMVISIFNGFGRVFWAWVSDQIGRAQVYFLLYAIQVPIFFTLIHVHSVAVFTVMFAIVGLCYGGGFGTMPSFTADFFGTRYMGGIYGWILLAWGAAAAPSPIMIASIREKTGAYGLAIHAMAIVMLCALILPILARYRPKSKQMAVQPEAELRKIA